MIVSYNDNYRWVINEADSTINLQHKSGAYIRLDSAGDIRIQGGPLIHIKGEVASS